MNHDPKEHFSEAQENVIREIFHGEINKMLIKIVATNLVIVIMAVMALGANFYRVNHLEEAVKTLTASVYEVLPSKEYVDSKDVNLQNQINERDKRLDRIETKLDVILERI